MRLFESARIRLAFWYLVISAFITLSFSAIVYGFVARELELGFIVAEYRLRGQPVPQQRVKILLEDELADAKNKVLLRFLIVDGVIIATAGIGGYILAGKTLKPIKDSLEEQKRFTADASHELKTPLTSLRSEIEVSLRDKKIKKNAKVILKSNLEEVEKMQELINYLLSLNKYENSEIVFNKESFNTKPIILEIVDKHKTKAKQNKVKINTKLVTTKAKINKTSFEELISIFLDNAIKYTLKNGGVSILSKKEGKNLIIRIKDTGIGIADEDLPYIFNRFYRADTSRCKNEFEGYGLGLSIAKTIVDLHGGKINVKSKIDKGTEFKITIPRS